MTTPNPTSPWLDRPRPQHPLLVEPGTYDVVVVGGGLAGLVTALLVARGGRSVAVLEAGRVGGGTTGRSTAKVSLLQGTRLGRIAHRSPPRALQHYVEANREGQAWLRGFCDDHDVPYDVRPAWTWAGTRRGEVALEAEAAAAEAAGLPIRRETDTELPFAVRAALRLDDQLQLDPVALVDALVAELVIEGGRVFELSPVVDVRPGDGVTSVVTPAVEVGAGFVVLATNQPILRRHGFFARLTPQRSYGAALRSVTPPAGMYLSTDPDTRSVRSARLPGGGEEEALLVGGAGHVTGRGGSERAHADALLDWATRTWPGAEPTHVWSAQDQRSVTALPYAGPAIPADETLLVTTGFDKWGLTNAPAAALALTKRIYGKPLPDWAEAYATWSSRELGGVPTAIRENAVIGARLAGGLGARVADRDRPPLCTHLGGVLRWNDAEESWDCPLHGSRFDADGTVIEGPAVRPLDE